MKAVANYYYLYFLKRMNVWYYAKPFKKYVFKKVLYLEGLLSFMLFAKMHKRLGPKVNEVEEVHRNYLI